MQRAVLQWLGMVLPRGSVVHHVANETAVDPKRSPKAKAAYFQARRLDGVLDGFPDLLVLLPGRKALFIEMKRPVKGRLSEEQKALIPEIEALGFPVAVARSIEEVRAVLIADGVALRHAIVPEVRAA